MRSISKTFFVVLITLGILFIWAISEMLLYSLFGKSALTTIIGIGLAFVIGAYLLFAIRKAWKE